MIGGGERNRPGDGRAKEVFDRVEREVERRWGIPVRIADVPDPFTSDLEGAQIAIDHAHDGEGALFLLDAWLSDFAACDFAYLRHFYRTGEKAPFFGFWRAGAARLSPRPIPPFRTTRWKARRDGVVV